jgi:hypothetical protein
MGDHSYETFQLQNRRVDEELEDEEELEEESEEESESEEGDEEEEGSNETLKLQNSRGDEESTRYFLSEDVLDLDDDTTSWILNHIDSFVSQCRVNESIEEVWLYPYSVYGHDDDVWDKVGQGIGNLKALKSLRIASYNYGEVQDDEDSPILDCEILVGILSQVGILSHVRQSIAIDITDFRMWDTEESRLFARAIRGHPTITSFKVGRNFTYESSDALYSALATLPALESITLASWSEDESTLAHPESLTELLRTPSLQSVCFEFFDFTPALFQATATALMEGTVITRLEFKSCSFPAEGSVTVLANALTRNTSVSYIEVESPSDGTLNGALATALPLNSTWRDLVLSGSRFDDDLEFSPVLLALGKKTNLKTLKVDSFGSMDESLCTAMKDGLGMNATLESLKLNDCLCDDNSFMVWCRALSFLRTNKALKSLMVNLDKNVPESCVSTLRCHLAAMLQENTSLESLSIRKSGFRIGMKAEEYFSLVTALQHNTTLKSLDLGNCNGFNVMNTLKKDEDMQMAALLKKNYVLERLPGINLKDRVSDVLSILRLNAAGRRYLVQDGSSISKGVQVLSRVNKDMNGVFLHLLENPRLCDRSAVEKVSAGESNGRSTNPTVSSDDGGKREQASAHKGRESRRRLE